MKNLILKLIHKISETLKSGNESGWSARKMTALVITIMGVIVGHILYYRYATKHDNWTLYPEILLIDYGMIGLLLGLTTWQMIRAFKKKDQPAADK